MTAKEKQYLYDSIGSKIKQFRISSNLSQVQLAEKLKKSRVTIVNIENGKQQTSLSMLVELSRIFNKKLDDFIPEDSTNETSVLKSLNKKLNKEAIRKSKSHGDIIETKSIMNFLKSINKENS